MRPNPFGFYSSDRNIPSGEHAKALFKKDFPEVFDLIQDYEHPVEDWRQEYIKVEEFANRLPRVFISKKNEFTKDWQEELASHVPSCVPKEVIELFSEKKSLLERAELFQGIASMEHFLQHVCLNDPISPNRPLERHQPQACVRVREEIWNLFQSQPNFLPQIAILTHQPMKKLQSVIKAVDDDFLWMACCVSNFEAFTFLYEFGNYASSSRMNVKLAMDCLKEVRRNKQYEFFSILVNKLEADSGIVLPLQSFLERSFDYNSLLGSGPPLSFVKFLVEEKGCDPNKPSDPNKDCDPNEVTEEEATMPLHSACLFETPNLEVVEYLLSKGADVNVQTPKGVTPLMLAFESGYWPLIRFLLENGADLNRVCQRFSRNHPYGSVLNFALSTCRNPMRLVKFLVEEKNMDIRHWDRISPLFNSAAFRGAGYLPLGEYVEVNRYLLEKGADLLLFDFSGRCKSDERGPSQQECHLVRLALDIIAGQDSPLTPREKQFLGVLKRQYEVMRFLAFAYTKTFILLCAIAIGEPLSNIQSILKQVKNLFEDADYADLLFKLCRKLHPKALNLLPTPPSTDESVKFRP